jgi:hypothetical protein
MNSILELMAARAAGTGNPAVNEMLSRLRNSSGADLQQNVRDLLSKVGSSNPIAGLLASQLTQAKTAGAEHQPPVIEAEVEASTPMSTEEHVQANEDVLRELRHQVESMFTELKALRERTDALASALGACCLCWGQDPECRFCHGRGAPGFAMPDESLLAELVLPAIRILQAHRVRSAAFSPKPQPHNPETGMPAQGERLS